MKENSGFENSRMRINFDDSHQKLSDCFGISEEEYDRRILSVLMTTFDWVMSISTGSKGVVGSAGAYWGLINKLDDPLDQAIFLSPIFRQVDYLKHVHAKMTKTAISLFGADFVETGLKLMLGEDDSSNKDPFTTLTADQILDLRNDFREKIGGMQQLAKKVVSEIDLNE